MSNSCKAYKEQLIACLKQSPCMTIEGKTFQECLRSKEVESISDACYAARLSYNECRRGQLDMRKRMRGNM